MTANEQPITRRAINAAGKACEFACWDWAAEEVPVALLSDTGTEGAETSRDTRGGRVFETESSGGRGMNIEAVAFGDKLDFRDIDAAIPTLVFVMDGRACGPVMGVGTAVMSAKAW
jgi:hypothetical protein